MTWEEWAVCCSWSSVRFRREPVPGFWCALTLAQASHFSPSTEPALRSCSAQQLQTYSLIWRPKMWQSLSSLFYVEPLCGARHSLSYLQSCIVKLCLSITLRNSFLPRWNFKIQDWLVHKCFQFFMLTDKRILLVLCTTFVISHPAFCAYGRNNIRVEASVAFFLWYLQLPWRKMTFGKPCIGAVNTVHQRSEFILRKTY